MPLVHPVLLGRAVPLAAPDTDGGRPATAPASLGAALAGWEKAGDVLRDEGPPVGLATLGELARRLAADADLWRGVVRHNPQSRWYTRLLLTGAVEVWLIGWAPGQGTEIHDHGGALGALAVAAGAVEEDVHAAAGSWRPVATHRHGAGEVVRFAADHVHRVVNRANAPATTVHAYSPPQVPLRYAPTEAS
jgi:predicted metal-dependent enzyme (double-stranded beta helix superfamily)